MDEAYSTGPVSKFRKLGEDSQVKVARNKFKNVLKHMVQEKLMQEEESESDNEDSAYRYKYKPGINMLGRKGHKSGHEAPKAKIQPAFVMKLFDRGVDLAQFNDATPLYPICRAWIQNKPHASRQRREPEEPEYEPEELDYREDTGEVFHLQPPEPLPYDEYGCQISYRVPPPLGPSDLDEPFDINYAEEDAPSPAILFQNHLDRWTLIRHRWKEASDYNESRFGASFGMLREIYERNRPEETTVAVATTTEGGEMVMAEGEAEVDGEVGDMMM